VAADPAPGASADGDKEDDSVEARSERRARRIDAVRNSEAVFEAAEKVFAKRGIDASMDEVAMVAGLGKATVYRSWPSKDELIAALLCKRVLWFTNMTRNIQRSSNALETVRVVLQSAIESQATNRLFNLAAVIEIPETDLLRAHVADSLAAVQELLDEGREDGSIRQDVNALDVWTLFNGATGVLNRRRETDIKVWLRCATLVADALRPGPSVTADVGARKTGRARATGRGVDLMPDRKIS
jgi:AcrR family transcriptional regulator